MNQTLEMRYIDKQKLGNLLSTLFPQEGWTIEVHTYGTPLKPQKPSGLTLLTVGR